MKITPIGPISLLLSHLVLFSVLNDRNWAIALALLRIILSDHSSMAGKTDAVSIRVPYRNLNEAEVELVAFDEQNLGLKRIRASRIAPLMHQILLLHLMKTTTPSLSRESKFSLCEIYGFADKGKGRHNKWYQSRWFGWDKTCLLVVMGSSSHAVKHLGGKSVSDGANSLEISGKGGDCWDARCLPQRENTA
ncbi:hypothetical protein Syun_021024 [Stephania yunnanensis]|uniref:Uncharacterized protein n=1 Tax=Stephania yunnanensis TaxID=152371 RepID=A0AAP0IGW8_9MAGN